MPRFRYFPSNGQQSTPCRLMKPVGVEPAIEPLAGPQFNTCFRDIALIRAQRAAADIGAAVAKRLLNARLPGMPNSDGAATLDTMWMRKGG